LNGDDVRSGAHAHSQSKHKHLNTLYKQPHTAKVTSFFNTMDQKTQEGSEKATQSKPAKLMMVDDHDGSRRSGKADEESHAGYSSDGGEKTISEVKEVAKQANSQSTDINVDEYVFDTDKSCINHCSKSGKMISDASDDHAPSKLSAAGSSRNTTDANEYVSILPATAASNTTNARPGTPSVPPYRSGRPILPESTVKYNRDDVLLGRGVPIQRHPGNKRMHRIVETYREQYRNASRAEKTLIVRNTIYEIREGGTRFLRRVDEKSEFDEDSDDWRDVSEDIIYEKISHALRGNGGRRKGSASSSSPARKSKTKAALTQDVDLVKAKAIPSSANTSETAGSPAAATSSLPGLWASLAANRQDPQVGQLISALLPNLTGSGAMASTTAQAMPFVAAQSLGAAQLLQQPLLSQQMQQQQQMQSVQGTNTPAILAGLQSLLGSRQQGLGLTGSTAPPVVNLGPLMRALVQQQHAQQTQVDSSQLLNVFLSTPIAPSNDQGTLAGALNQLLQQQRQQQQVEAEVLRRLEQEVAMRRLTSAMGNGNQAPHPASEDPNALLLSLLLGNLAALTNSNPNFQPNKR
jgi:hypothetical protein